MRIVDKCEPIKQKKAPKIVTNNVNRAEFKQTKFNLKLFTIEKLSFKDKRMPQSRRIGPNRGTQAGNSKLLDKKGQ